MLEASVGWRSSVTPHAIGADRCGEGTMPRISTVLLSSDWVQPTGVSALHILPTWHRSLKVQRVFDTKTRIRWESVCCSDKYKQRHLFSKSLFEVTSSLIMKQNNRLENKNSMSRFFETNLHCHPATLRGNPSIRAGEIRCKHWGSYRYVESVKSRVKYLDILIQCSKKRDHTNIPRRRIQVRCSIRFSWTWLTIAEG